MFKKGVSKTAGQFLSESKILKERSEMGRFWDRVLQPAGIEDITLADAILDRLVHNAYKIERDVRRNPRYL